MSLVGPRPEIPEMLRYYGASAETVLAVKPGLTSLAKVSGRDQLTFSETLEYDIMYVLRQSLWLDAKILVRTALTLFRDGWVRS
jgi:lipopolysaccharide/colanic/teichoic acid biosynthesis glycosyltransferase